MAEKHIEFIMNKGLMDLMVQTFGPSWFLTSVPDQRDVIEKYAEFCLLYRLSVLSSGVDPEFDNILDTQVHEIAKQERMRRIIVTKSLFDEAMSAPSVEPGMKRALELGEFNSACHFSDRLKQIEDKRAAKKSCLLYTSPSPRDRQKPRMPSSA